MADLLSVFNESFVSFFLIEVLQESRSIRENCIDVRLVLNSQLKRPVQFYATMKRKHDWNIRIQVRGHTCPVKIVLRLDDTSDWKMRFQGHGRT